MGSLNLLLVQQQTDITGGLSLRLSVLQTEMDLILKEMFFFFCVLQENESTTVSDSTECDAKSSLTLQYVVYLQRKANIFQVGFKSPMGPSAILALVSLLLILSYTEFCFYSR